MNNRSKSKEKTTKSNGLGKKGKNMEHTLSSGVKVVFTRIPESIATDVMVNSFKHLKFDDKGNLKDTKNVTEQLEAASKIQKYHNKLIAFGVSLVGEISDYVELAGIGDNWLNKLKYAETDLSAFDLTDTNDLTFIFLRHYGFKSPEDFEALSKNTLGNS